MVAEKEDKELSGDKVLGWPWLLLPIYLVYEINFLIDFFHFVIILIKKQCVKTF